MSNSEIAIQVEKLGKRYNLGEVHSDKFAEVIGLGSRQLYRRLLNTISPKNQRNDEVSSHQDHGFDQFSLDSIRYVQGRPNLNKKKELANRLRSNSHVDKQLWAIHDVSFSIKRGEVVGIIGLNGAGKSTLFKILARITEPTEGQAILRGRVASLLEVGTGFHPELTGRENIYLNGTILGMTRTEINNRFDEIVAFAEVERFLETPVKRYSSGMYVRLAFAIAAHLEPEILLVDEVLAVGDAAFQHKCLGKMREATEDGRTILFVSHNMLTVQALCPRSLLLESGKVTFIGNTAEAVSKYLKHNSLTSKSFVNLRKHNGRSLQYKPVFQSIRIFNSASKESSIAHVGDPITFEIEMDAHGETVENPKIQIYVKDARETLICRFSTDIMTKETMTLSEPRIARCFWHLCNLVPGIYTLNLVLSNDGKSVDIVQDAIAIEIKPSDIYGTGKIDVSGGLIIPQGNWEFSSLP